MRIEVGKNSVLVNYSSINMHLNVTKSDQWLHLIFKSSNSLNITSFGVFDFDTQKLNSINVTKSSVFNNMLMPNFATVYLGNNPQGNSPYSGMIREFRIWSEFRSERDIFMLRNIELRSGSTNLIHYFKMVGDSDNLRITESFSNRTKG